MSDCPVYWKKILAVLELDDGHQNIIQPNRYRDMPIERNSKRKCTISLRFKRKKYLRSNWVYTRSY